MVLFFWWCRPPRKPFKDKVSELYTCVFMCGCSFLKFSYLCFSAVALLRFKSFFQAWNASHFDFDLNSEEIFILFIYVLTLAKTAAVKSFAWFLSLSPLPTAASIHESPTRKRGARNLDQPGACAFRIPLAENSLWASWSLLQICSFNLFTHYS